LKANGDYKALREYPAPKPFMYITGAHLVEQTAEELAAFSSVLDV